MQYKTDEQFWDVEHYVKQKKSMAGQMSLFGDEPEQKPVETPKPVEAPVAPTTPSVGEKGWATPEQITPEHVIQKLTEAKIGYMPSIPRGEWHKEIINRNGHRTTTPIHVSEVVRATGLPIEHLESFSKPRQEEIEKSTQKKSTKVDKNLPWNMSKEEAIKKGIGDYHEGIVRQAIKEGRIQSHPDYPEEQKPTEPTGQKPIKQRLEESGFHGTLDRLNRGLISEQQAEGELAGTHKPDIKEDKPASAEDLASKFKRSGIGRQESWSRYVQAMALKPQMDAKDWYRLYDQS